MNDKKKSALFPLIAFLLVISGLSYKFGERWLRFLLLYLSGAEWAREMVGSSPIARRVAGRFVAGENVDAALAASRELNAKGMLVTLDVLGENVTSVQDTFDARDQILNLFDRIHETGVNANVSVKLTQLGLRIEPDLARDNVRQLLERARRYDNRVRIDMEESEVTERTLQIYRSLRDEYGFGHRTGIVIQSYLYRSLDDVRKLVSEGAWVRLCKGAYAEPPEVAFPVKADTDANFVKLLRLMLSQEALENGVHLGIATHDEKMIRAAKAWIQEQNVDSRYFEFQMLYGIRRDLQGALAAEGYPVRIYVPFGTAWYPYFVRRLAEHPANLWFFISNLFRR